MAASHAELGAPDSQSTDFSYHLDKAVIKVFPAATEILSAERWGKSSWNVTVRINTLDSDKREKQYSLKCAMPGEHGKMMMKGEFSAMA